MIDLSSLFRVAYNALLRNKLRSLLTTLGVVIGVAAVILLVSIGHGLQSYVESQFENIGSNMVYVMPFDATDSEGQFSGPQGPPSSTLKGFSKADVRVIERIGFPIVSATPIIEKLVDVSYKGTTDTKTINAATSDYQIVRSFKLASGRFYTKSEDEKNRRVVVIGSEAAESLFGNEYPIGKTITISAVKYKVIGVLESIGSIGIGPNVDDEVYIPLNAGLNLFNVNVFDFIAVKVASSDDIDLAITKIENALLTRRDEDQFSVFDQAQLLSTITNILGVITAAVGGIGAISLLVGGIGIMNIMLVSVAERTREIGLRKAIGATPKAILIQFLIEAALLSLLGGCLGIALGLTGSYVLDKVFPSTVSADSVIIAFTVSAGVGILFGFLPARRASKLSPIEALIQE